MKKFVKSDMEIISFNSGNVISTSNGCGCKEFCSVCDEVCEKCSDVGTGDRFSITAFFPGVVCTFFPK